MTGKLPLFFCALAALSLAACAPAASPAESAAPSHAAAAASVPSPSPLPAESAPAASPAESAAPPTPEPSDVPSEPSDLPAFSPAQASEEAAWIPCEQGARFGGDPEVDCPLAVWDARVGLNDLSVSFLPQGNADAMSAFIAAEIRIPPTEVTYAEENRALLIRMEGVVLDTGDPREAAGSDDWVYDFMEEFGLPLPASFPMGSLGEDNGFFRNAAISSDGTDTLITLLLTDRAGELRVESGTLDREGMQPWFRIVFQEAP